MLKTRFLSIKHWSQYVRYLKTEIYTLYLAYQDPRTPWYAKVCAACVAAYAFSPIDLIPDFIPVLGYLDDLILLPLGIFFTLKLIPPPVLAESRTRAAERISQGKPISRWGAIMVITIWGVMLGLVVIMIIEYM